jgi:putative SOS response-associated peptidase YedK
MGLVTIDLFALLTTEPNGSLDLVHPKAMPVLRTTKKKVETWLIAPNPMQGGSVACPTAS